jgi:hypothetical protein
MWYFVICFYDVHVIYMWYSKCILWCSHSIHMLFTKYTCDVQWCFLWYLLSKHVMFYDKFSVVYVICMQCSTMYLVIFHVVFIVVHVIYTRCSMMYSVMFYDVFSDVHLVYMWCSIVLPSSSKEYNYSIVSRFSTPIVYKKVFVFMILNKYY